MLCATNKSKAQSIYSSQDLLDTPIFKDILRYTLVKPKKTGC